MSDDPYERFRVPHPEHIGEAHTEAIDLELRRFARAVDDHDDGQAIGYLKCLIEAVAKVVHDLDGRTVAGAANFDSTVHKAHECLAKQPGYELADPTPFGNLATQARKMAVSMSTIRNGYGGGHGRARQPDLKDEMLDLAMDGSLLWIRWAIRRMGYFALGRPETLIRDLIGDPTGQIDFFSGDLSARLHSADLPRIDPRHARAIGLAVGQRAAGNTFNVRGEGVTPAVGASDLERWPSSYRVGVANGLLFSPDELATVTVRNVEQALRVCLPVTEEEEEITDLLRRVMTTSSPRPGVEDPRPHQDLVRFVEQSAESRPADEQQAWRDLAQYLRGGSANT